jgi:hypothetical protein
VLALTCRHTPDVDNLRDVLAIPGWTEQRLGVALRVRSDRLAGRSTMDVSRRKDPARRALAAVSSTAAVVKPYDKAQEREQHV